MANHGNVSAAGRIQWFIERAQSADDGFLHVLGFHIMFRIKFLRFLKDIQRFSNVRITVRKKRKNAERRVEGGHASVCAALNPDMFVEVAV